MADEAKRPDLYVCRIDAVRKSIDALLQNKTHEHVPGYLALLRSARRTDNAPSQIGDIVELYDRYLKVLDAGSERPYLRPFVSRGRNIWFNDNVSGSYAPSNVKADPGPFFRVVDVGGSGLNTTYSLPTDHAGRAAEHLFRGHKLPITALTIFMYRDYGFTLETPSITSVVELFRNEFHLRASQAGERATFETLFIDDTQEFADNSIELMKG